MSITKPVKRVIKRSLEHLAAGLGPHTWKPNSPRLLILMYHRILPAEDERSRTEEPGMIVTPATFSEHLKLLSEYFEFVSLSDWLQRRHEGLPLPAKACAVTFDDGWADNYEFAFPVLQLLQIPATIFLVADMIDTKKMFWPEHMARLVSKIAETSPQAWSNSALNWLTDAKTDYQYEANVPTNEQISQFIAHVKRYPDTEIFSLIQKSEDALNLEVKPEKPALLTWKQVSQMISSGLVEVGSHTCRHIRLGEQTPIETTAHEIITSKATIEQHTGQNVRVFCFPNGDYTERALALVKNHYIGSVTTANGWNSATTDSYLLHRIGIHEDISSDRSSFLARVSGWL